jgi:hypothetical protein
MLMIYFVGGLGIGWLISQLQPSVRGAMVLLCAASFVFPFLPTLLRLTIDSFENSRFTGYMWDQLLMIGLVSTGSPLAAC